MQVDFSHKPAHTIARVTLQPGEQVVAESGAMVATSANVTMETQARGGVMKGLGRMFMGGESFFQNTFTAQQGAGEVYLAPSLMGDMVALPPNPNGYFLQSGSYIAASQDVQIDSKVGGFKTFFSGAGVFVLKATMTPNSTLLCGAFGAIQPMEVQGELIVDTGHLVAWDGALQYKTEKASSSFIGSFLSGEGLVVRFTGEGNVYVQSREPSAFGQALGSLMGPA